MFLLRSRMCTVHTRTIPHIFPRNQTLTIKVSNHLAQAPVCQGSGAALFGWRARPRRGSRAPVGAASREASSWGAGGQGRLCTYPAGTRLSCASGAVSHEMPPKAVRRQGRRRHAGAGPLAWNAARGPPDDGPLADLILLCRGGGI